MSAQTEPAWSRARSPVQKRIRQDAILDAAAVLIDELGIDKVSLSAIARKAQLSKANCYRYFENREAILLELLVEEGQSWTDQVVEQLSHLSDPASIEQLSEIVATATLERPRLCELTSALWTVLESNVSLDVVVGFKRRFGQMSAELCQTLSERLVDLSVEDAHQFASYYLMFMGSAWAAAKPSPTMQALFELDEFKDMQIDLRTTLRRHASLLLHGLLPGQDQVAGRTA